MMILFALIVHLCQCARSRGREVRKHEPVSRYVRLADGSYRSEAV